MMGRINVTQTIFAELQASNNKLMPTDHKVALHTLNKMNPAAAEEADKPEYVSCNLHLSYWHKRLPGWTFVHCTPARA